MRSIAFAALLLLSAGTAAAQTEQDLRGAFEGKEIRLKIDMPGSSNGVDVYPQRKPMLKADEWVKELRQYGVAIPKDSTTIVTRVRVRDEHIEFQLGGGGASSYGPGVRFVPTRKSAREVELEMKPDRNPREARELEDLMRQRRVADERAKQQAEQAAATRRASEGSRFNIRYETKITPAQLTPDAVRAALKEFVQFETMTASPPPPASAPGAKVELPATPPAKTIVDPDAERLPKQLVVMIKGQIGEEGTVGAGTIVGIRSDRMYIATANHVVRRGGNEIKDVRVLFDWLPGEWTAAKLLDTADHALDLAVLVIENAKRLSADHLVFDRLGAKPPRVGQGVFFIGHGASVTWHTRRAADAISGVSGETIRFQSAFLQPGDSGGVLVSEDWRIIGMLRSDNPGEADALSIQPIIDKLTEWNYPVALKAVG
jgi:S1-C subfamily serine protease